MSSLTDPPQRKALKRHVKKRFLQQGWDVSEVTTGTHDFVVSCGHLRFLVKCLDDTATSFMSSGTIVTRLEKDANTLLGQLNRIVIFILDRNFLSIPLESLLRRNIYALEVQDLGLVTNLSVYSETVPQSLDVRQSFLLQKNVDYAMFVSSKFRENGDYGEATVWARYAVENCFSFFPPYQHLFSILRDSGDLAAAEELGKVMIRIRPDDPQVLTALKDLARRRGDTIGMNEWNRRLQEKPTTPRTIKEILDKQKKLRHYPDTPPVSSTIDLETRPPSTIIGSLQTFIAKFLSR